MTMRRIAGSLAAFGAAAMLLAGCVSASLEDAAPVSAFAQPELPADVAARLDEEAAQEADGSRPLVSPGDYPNLNIIPTPAAPQITQEERDMDTTLLRSISERRGSEAAGNAVTDRAAELRRLGQRHADDTLRQIEGE